MLAAERPNGWRAAIRARSTFESYLSRVEVQASGCWIIKDKKPSTHDGYVQIGPRGSPRRAHVVFYERIVGPIPPGLELDHTCRNRACVRPKWSGDPDGHTEPVTRRVNLLRGETHPARNARKTVCDHGHPLTPGNYYLRERRNRPAPTRECKQRVHNRNARRWAARLRATEKEAGK